MADAPSVDPAKRTPFRDTAPASAPQSGAPYGRVGFLAMRAAAFAVRYRKLIATQIGSCQEILVIRSIMLTYKEKRAPNHQNNRKIFIKTSKNRSDMGLLSLWLRIWRE
jgi:hypothetical protein